MRFSISTKLTCAFSAMFVITVGLGVYAASSFGTIEGKTAVIVDNRVPSFILLGQTNADMGDVRIAQGALIGASPTEVEALTSDLKEADLKVRQEMSAYEPLLVDQADKDFFQNIKINGPARSRHGQRSRRS